MCRFFSYHAHSRTIRPFEQVFFSKQSRRLSRAPPALSRMNREEHVPVLRHRTYGMSGTGPCAGCAYVIMKPFSAYAAYGKGVLARSDFLPMESMERVSWREAIFRLWNLWNPAREKKRNPARAVRAPMNFAKFNFSLTSAISAYVLRPLISAWIFAHVHVRYAREQVRIPGVG